MGLVKVQNVMSNELAKRVFLSRPPEPPHEYLLNDPTDSIFIGISKIFNTPFTWSFENLTNPHLAVVGITGAGKSYFVKTFLIRASYIWNTNAIIIDWAGEYRAWVKQSGGKIVALGKGSYINLLDLSGMKPLDRVKQVVRSLEILTDISSYPEQRRLTMEAIEQSYMNAGFILSEPPDGTRDAPTLKDVISLLEEKLQEGTYEYPTELENAVYRLRQFAREGEDYFAQKSTLDLAKLTTSGLVDLDLSGLPDETFRALAALFILQSLKETMRMQGWSNTKGLKAIVVLDEAWKIAGDERSDAVMIVREGRKYNFGLIVASQNPTDINEAIFSNVGTTVILRVKFERFMDYLQGSLNFSDFMRREISQFGVGQGAVNMSFKTSVQFPEIFVVDKIIGEVPLDVYTISLGELLTPAENEDPDLQKEYYYEKIDIRNKMLDSGVSSDAIDKIVSNMDAKNRLVDVKELSQLLLQEGIDKQTIITVFRSMGIVDNIIARVFTYMG